MSSKVKNPLEKQDTPSESSGSSEKSSDKAEENLEHLRIEDHMVKEETKEEVDESKKLDSPNQEGILTGEMSNEPIAGPSRLIEKTFYCSDGSSKSKDGSMMKPDKDLQIKEESKDVGMLELDKKDIQMTGESEEVDMLDLNKKDVQTQTYMDNEKGQSPDKSDSSPSGLSFYKVDRMIQSPRPKLLGKPGAEGKKYAPLPWSHHGLPSSISQTASFRRGSYATDSANTSADVSEIHSEVADISTDGSVYVDASEFQKEDSPSVYVPAVESQAESSETSDTNISDLPEELAPPATPSDSSVSISTNTADEGHQGYLAQLQREADQMGTPISTSSGIGSTDQSELEHLQRWGLVGEMGSYRHNREDVDLPNQEVSEHVASGEQPQPLAESMQCESTSEGRMQDFESWFKKTEHTEEGAESSVAKGETRSGMLKGETKIEFSDVAGMTTSGRKKASKYLEDSSDSENVPEKSKPRVKPDFGKKGKTVAGKFSVPEQSSSESTEPKSSSSDELQRKESPDIQSSSGSQSDKAKKLWQKSGQLRGMQLSKVSSQDCVITEEDESQISPVESQKPELMDTTETSLSPGKMETTPDKSIKDDAKPGTLLSGQEASDLTSPPDETFMEHESGPEDSDFVRSVEQTKRRVAKLSTSSQSDDISGTTPPKDAEARRPKKKAREDKVSGKARKTRHDSGGTVPKTVGLESEEQGDSTSPTDQSDYSDSDEQETQF